MPTHFFHYRASAAKPSGATQQYLNPAECRVLAARFAHVQTELGSVNSPLAPGLLGLFVSVIALLGLADDSGRSAALTGVLAGSVEIAQPALRVLLVKRSTN